MLSVDTMFASYNDVRFKLDRYAADNSLVVQLYNEEGPIARLTVCLVDNTLGKSESYVDTNNCPWALEFILNNGLGEVTGRSRVSGFCVYPLVRFNIKELERYQ